MCNHMNIVSSSDNPLKASRLRIWMIVNPTSGRGNGSETLKRIVKAFRQKLSDAVVYTRSAHEAICEINNELQEESREDATLFSPPASKPTLSADAVELFISHKRLRIDIITTEETIFGSPIAEHITRAVVRTRIEQCRRDGFARTLHILVPVGGDGTLNEVINGMCRGTLQAFREAFSPDFLQDTIPSHARATTSLDASTLQYWTLMEEKAALSYMMPPLLYVSAGTGNDFAKLQLCCRDEADFINVVKSICTEMWKSDSLAESMCTPSKKKMNSTCSNCASDHDNVEDVSLLTTNGAAHTKNNNNSESKVNSQENGFAVYDVDIGRTFFPRTGNQCFFINECSCGMSCDVIRRCDKYKKSKLMSLAGGSVMFALASMVSVTKMRPKPLRIMPLPDTVLLPSAKDSSSRNYASPFIPSHVVVGDCALRNLTNDLRFIAESMRSASIPVADPLVVGADYYAYSKGLGDTPASPSSVEANPFFSTCPHRAHEYKKNHEILNALDESASNNPNGRWVSFPSSTLAFGNGRWFGGGLQITPHGNPTDGRLSMTNWVAGFLTFVSRAPSLYNGNHATWSSTTLWSTQRCVVDSDHCNETNNGTSDKQGRKEELGVLCETDGELREQLPAVVEICGAVKVFVPQRCVEKRGDCVKGGSEKRNSCCVFL